MKFDNMLSYCRALEENNNRLWFHENHKQYEIAKEDFTELVERVKFAAAERVETGLRDRLIFADPKTMLYRIPRDARVWPDKPPYNPAYRAHISLGGKHMLPAGCFVYIQPGDRSCVCGGFHPTAFRQATLMFREHIYYHMDEWENIIYDSEFSENFMVLGEKLKNVPREYDKDVYGGEWLKHKNWYIEHPLTDEEVLSESIGERIAQLYRIMRPFNEFITEGLADFKFDE